MKLYKILLIFTFTIVIHTNSFSQNFRKSRFEDKIEDIIKIEGEPYNVLTKEDENLVRLEYKDSLGGISSLVVYTFKNNKLINGVIDLSNGEILNKSSFEQYKTIEDLIISEYGEPTISIDYRTNKEFNNYAQIVSEWEVENLRISHMLLSKNLHIVNYSIKE
jgi:hypothetical protein